MNIRYNTISCVAIKPPSKGGGNNSNIWLLYPPHYTPTNTNKRFTNKPWTSVYVVSCVPGVDAAYLFPFRKPKRIRTAFSPSQLLQLEHAFEKNHYVVGQERKELAANLNLTETQVRILAGLSPRVRIAAILVSLLVSFRNLNLHFWRSWIFDRWGLGTVWGVRGGLNFVNWTGWPWRS